MSGGSRWAIAVVAAASAAGFALAAPALPKPSHGYAYAGFCLLIVLLCVAPRTRPVTARAVGGVVLAVCLAVWFQELRDVMRGPGLRGIGWRELLDRLYQASRVAMLFALPAAHAAVVGRYPAWGKLAAGFDGCGEAGRDEPGPPKEDVDPPAAPRAPASGWRDQVLPWVVAFGCVGVATWAIWPPDKPAGEAPTGGGRPPAQPSRRRTWPPARPPQSAPAPPPGPAGESRPTNSQES